MAPATHVRCFGSFLLRVGGTVLAVADLRPRLRVLVWYLALHADRTVHAEMLMEDLWPETHPDAARHNLQVAVSSLRGILEPGVRRGAWKVIEREGEGYRLNLGEGGSSDLSSFELAVMQARGHHDLDAAARALTAYDGELIPEAGPLSWLVDRRGTCRAEAAGIALLLAEAKLAGGDAISAMSACRKGLLIDRYVDGLWRTLIAAARANGDHAVALRAGREYRGILAELGVAS
jgi:DNA-binding SARP family transcriptional activator